MTRNIEISWNIYKLRRLAPVRNDGGAVDLPLTGQKWPRGQVKDVTIVVFAGL